MTAVLSGFDAQLRARVLAIAFVAVCVVAGGSSRGGVVAHAVIDCLAALALIVAVWTTSASDYTRAAWALMGLAAAAIGVAALQLVPLPPDIWTSLPGRELAASGFALLGVTPGSLPASLTPGRTLAALLGFLPPLAAFVLFAAPATRKQATDLAWTLPALATASAMFGIAQVYGGPNSPLYVYASTNAGSPVGFLANVNHQATLMLVAAPFAAALIGQTRIRAYTGHADAGTWLLLAAVGLCVVLGAMIAGSFAGYLLLGPTLVVCVLLVFGGGRLTSAAHWLGLVAGAAALGALGWFVASSPALRDLGVTDLSTGPASRANLFTETAEAVRAFFPVGSGLGSFERAYPHFEAQGEVGDIFAPHAHNDYLQIAMELGLPGVLLILGALGWWAVMSFQAWSAEDSSDVRIRRAASVALGVIALHSIVDYPLRTATISVIAGACAGLLAAPAVVRRRDVLPSSQPATQIEL